MLRPLLILILICGPTLLTSEVMAQSQHHEQVQERTIDESFERLVCFTEELPQRGPLFGAWGKYETRDPSEPPDPIATDRPDFTESSTTVGAGVAQIEAGYTYTRRSNEQLRSHAWGEPLLRVGVVADWIELRAALAPTSEIANIVGNGLKESGVEDLYLGVKIGLTAQSSWLPELSVVPQMTFPTGNTHFTSGRTLPGCNLIYGWDITESLSSTGSTQFNFAVNGNDTYVEWAQSWTLGLALTDTVGCYSEWFAIIPNGSFSMATEQYLDGGLTWRLNDDIQLDARVGTGLNDAAADFFGGIGLSMRFR